MNIQPTNITDEEDGKLFGNLDKVVRAIYGQHIRILSLKEQNFLLQAEIAKLVSEVNSLEAELVRQKLSINGLYRCIERLAERLPARD